MDNWAEIADYLGTKTAHECEVHYYDSGTDWLQNDFRGNYPDFGL